MAPRHPSPEVNILFTPNFKHYNIDICIALYSLYCQGKETNAGSLFIQHFTYPPVGDEEHPVHCLFCSIEHKNPLNGWITSDIG